MSYWLLKIILMHCVSLWSTSAYQYNSGKERVLLENVKAITLHQGKMTTGRRSAGVPQLQCKGGSAGCKSFTPVVVQCQNMGSDGFDVQWECKTDMDDSYRFGKIQVTCEGYDYPNDPYILRGSCGLEYTIDYTEAGKRRQNSYGGSHNYNTYVSTRSTDGSWLIFFGLVVVVCLLIYFMTSSNSPLPQDSPNHRSPDFGNHRGTPDNSRPPPYGFKPEYTGTSTASAPPPPSYTESTYDSHAGSSTNHGTYTRTTTQGRPGFWTGMGLGGLAGYLFGSRNNHGGYYNRGYGSGYGYGSGFGSGYGYSRGYGGGYDSHYGSGGGFSLGGSSVRSRGSSSSTRTTSGFGGTSRR